MFPEQAVSHSSSNEARAELSAGAPLWNSIRVIIPVPPGAVNGGCRRPAKNRKE